MGHLRSGIWVGLFFPPGTLVGKLSSHTIDFAHTYAAGSNKGSTQKPIIILSCSTKPWSQKT